MDAALRPSLTSAATELRRLLRPVAGQFRIREERPRDFVAREALLDRSFGLGRFAKTCERLRENRMAATDLSFVATVGSTIVGTLRFWHVEAGRQAALLLGPLAVDASQRGAGIGSALLDHGLTRARKLGHDGVILVGDAPYYQRFGFAHGPVQGLVLPGPVDLDRFLGLEFVRGSLTRASGRVVAAGLIVDGYRRGEDRLAA